ncbi:MAG: RdgB/HAM1 family non-canonical purine NTP pyrophosphatase [Anaerolineales bacterium]|jgi:XTP/dITP diphosphohydrolase
MSLILLASSNPGKLHEIQAIMSGTDWKLVTPDQMGLDIEVEESGITYAENAALKARAYAEVSQILTLADDSGLEVDVLGGLPGIKSARFSAKEGATDADRRDYLLARLHDYQRPWLAKFHCTVALARPVGKMYFSSGDCWGEIIPEERGEGGFGYDPIFLIPELGRTMAELTMEEKNQLSHRARAIKAAFPILTNLIATES